MYKLELPLVTSRITSKMLSRADLEALTKLLAPPDDEEGEEKKSSNLTEQESSVPYQPFHKPSKPIPESEKNFSAIITSTRRQNYGDNICMEQEQRSEEKQVQSQEITKPDLIEPKYSIIDQHNLTARDAYYIDHFSEDKSDSIVIKIILEQENVSSIDVKVDKDETTLLLQSKKYYLSLPLPHKVHHDKYTAKWHKDIETLEINLKIKYEYSFTQ